MFVAGEAADDLRQVELERQRPFAGRHYPELARGHDRPLPLETVADTVLLQVAGAVEVAIPPLKRPRIVERTEPVDRAVLVLARRPAG